MERPRTRPIVIEPDVTFGTVTVLPRGCYIAQLGHQVANFVVVD